MYQNLLAAGVVALTFLAGCSSPGNDTDTAAADATLGSGCDSSAVQYVIGQTVTPALVEEVRTRSGATQVRVVRPDDMITMDFNSARMTLNTDASLTIKTATCG